MGVQALEGNGITTKLLFLARDKSLTSTSEPLKRIQRRSAIWIFVGIQLLGFGATFAITQTIAAVGFPIIVLLLIPLRTFILPKWFSPEELSLLDAPTASQFTMISVGGNFGESMEDAGTPMDGNEDDTAVPSGVETPANMDGGLFATRVENDRDECRAERGEGLGVGLKRRGSRWSEGRTEVGLVIEMMRREHGLSRRSFSRQG